jgi:hypothetical protein
MWLILQLTAYEKERYRMEFSDKIDGFVVVYRSTGIKTEKWNRQKHDKTAEENEKLLQTIMFFFDERREEFCSVVFWIRIKASPLF